MITFDRVHFGYAPDQPIARDLSFTIERGEFLGIIGPNGAGKSTVLGLMSGLHAPTSGTVRIDGLDPSRADRKEVARRIAIVGQDESTDFPFTSREVVLMGRTPHLSPLGFERAADFAAADRAMLETHTADLAERPIYALSGGERKRVLIARALAQAAPIIALDEPAAALDIRHQIAIFDLLADLHRRGSTVVVVVHDLNLAAAYCKRLLLLRRDAPAELGPIEQVLTYKHVREVFGVDVYVGVNEITGARYLIPMSNGASPSSSPLQVPPKP